MDSAKLTVRVLFEDSPADGVSVILRDADSGENLETLFTSQDGSVFFSDLSPGIYHVLPNIPGFWVFADDTSEFAEIELAHNQSEELVFSFVSG